MNSLVWPEHFSHYKSKGIVESLNLCHNDRIDLSGNRFILRYLCITCIFSGINILLRNFHSVLFAFGGARLKPSSPGDEITQK